jgi:regulator of protease activity HflC (stomatin/prohibitin superfamily)
MTEAHHAMSVSRERAAWTTSGYLMLAVFLALLAFLVWRFFGFAGAPPEDPAEVGGFVVTNIVGIVLLILIAKGFYMIQPNQAVAITLFGSYRGTDRNTGLRWIWPWMGKRKISVRANNLISERIKVNDLRGNPIEMAAQVVWRVVDTAQALYDVDDYKAFVVVQIEAAVRTIGSRYPYDDFTHKEVTLRGNHDQVGAELRTELIARLQLAGITVDECGFTHLAYAQEIASAMLRRQQAEAVVAARKTLVEGAVGMVEMALAMLSEKNVVELDDERRAAMVSNLMVVLCGERDTQPVVNTGTLYPRAGDGRPGEKGIPAPARSGAARPDRAPCRRRAALGQRAARMSAARGPAAPRREARRARSAATRATAEGTQDQDLIFVIASEAKQSRAFCTAALDCRGTVGPSQ